MFTFLPQILIIISIAGIIFIVLRRTPEIRQLPLGQIFRGAGGSIRRGLVFGARQFWSFALDAKELSKKGAQSFPRGLRRIPLPKRKFRLPALDLKNRLLAEAQRFMETGEFEKAESALIKVLEEDKQNESAYDGLGRLYLAQNKFREAAETYKFLTKHYPEKHEHFIHLAESYRRQNRLHNAAEALERGIELAPDQGDYYIQLGKILEQENHPEEAILNYRKAVELEPGKISSLLLLADALVKKGEREDAAKTLEQVLVAEPTNEDARQKLMKLKF